MSDDEFREEVFEYLGEVNAGEITRDILPGTALFHAANVRPSEYSRTWMSTKAGRFSPALENAKYFAERVEICAAEIGFPPGDDAHGVTFESGNLTTQLKALDTSKLPQILQTELIADKLSATKWHKSHIFMEEFRANDKFSDVPCVLYQSVSGQEHGMEGRCLVFTSEVIPISEVATGDLTKWKSGDIAGLTDKEV